MTPAIKTKNLTKTFRKGRGWFDLLGKRSGKSEITRALDGVDLTIEKGEVFCLLGPNGAGKTTLIKVLCTLTSPDSGYAAIHGMDLLKDPERVRGLLSLVLGEERSFYWRLTGRQNLEFFATLYNLSKKQARERIERAAHLFGITDLDKRYQEYSTGLKQRLALARSFLNDAKVIFMDEPTRSLDPLAARGLREIIRGEIRRDPERSVFFTTHQTQEAEGLADRIAILDQGKIRACGTLEELRRLAGRPGASLEVIFQRLVSEETMGVS